MEVAGRGGGNDPGDVIVVGNKKINLNRRRSADEVIYRSATLNRTMTSLVQQPPPDGKQDGVTLPASSSAAKLSASSGVGGHLKNQKFPGIDDPLADDDSTTGNLWQCCDKEFSFRKFLSQMFCYPAIGPKWRGLAEEARRKFWRESGTLAASSGGVLGAGSSS